MIESKHGWRLKLQQLLSGLRYRYCMWRLRRLLGSDFDEHDFVHGARQLASYVMDAARQSDWSRIRSCCTEHCASVTYSQQRQNLCNQLVRFESQHLLQVLPLSVHRAWEQGRRYVFVDLAFTGLRDMQDFDSSGEQQQMRQLVLQVLQQAQLGGAQLTPMHQRLVLGEFLLSLRRELTQDSGWLVDFYKMHCIKLVNFSPVTLQYRVIEFLNPFQSAKF
ncbi:CG9863 [Drosophila busckii]|uniref:CG9863 n=1 Tax=Drosophila busckii TaxID=30019 RepID=A0A0M4EUY7_DROBS|nr:CG9863 [Drosophila busckii]